MPGTPYLRLPGRHWLIDGGTFANPPSFTFWCQGLLLPVSLGYKHITLPPRWFPVPSLRIMMVSSTCRFIKFSRGLVWLVALPGPPSTGQSMDMEVFRKATRYSVGVVRSNVSGKGLAWPDRPLYVWRWETMYATANSAPQSSHTALQYCITW